MWSWPEPKPRVQHLIDWATEAPHKSFSHLGLPALWFGIWVQRYGRGGRIILPVPLSALVFVPANAPALRLGSHHTAPAISSPSSWGKRRSYMAFLSYSGESGNIEISILSSILDSIYWSYNLTLRWKPFSDFAINLGHLSGDPTCSRHKPVYQFIKLPCVYFFSVTCLLFGGTPFP